MAASVTDLETNITIDYVGQFLDGQPSSQQVIARAHDLGQIVYEHSGVGASIERIKIAPTGALEVTFTGLSVKDSDGAFANAVNRVRDIPLQGVHVIHDSRDISFRVRVPRFLKPKGK